MNKFVAVFALLVSALAALKAQGAAPSSSGTPNCFGNDYELNKRVLQAAELDALSATQLHLLRNEIFARHCYKFKKQYLQEYAAGKLGFKDGRQVYVPVEGIGVNLNAEEKKNLELIQKAEGPARRRATSQAKDTGAGYRSELNAAKGRELCLKVALVANHPKRTLCVLQVELAESVLPVLSLDGVYADVDPTLSQARFGVIDIDRKDPYLEFVVRGHGIKHFKSIVYFERNGRLELAGSLLEGMEDSLLDYADGSGKLKALAWGHVLHDWGYFMPYRLDAAHRLQAAPQDSYEMNANLKVKIALNIQRSPTDPTIVATLQPSEDVVILSSDDKKWCLAQNSKGVRGWFAVEGKRVLELNKVSSEVFDGLAVGE